MKKYVIALDQGTTSSRAVIFDEQAKIVAMKSYEFEQIYPKIDAAMVNFTDEINVKDGVMDLPPYAIAILPRP